MRVHTSHKSNAKCKMCAWMDGHHINLIKKVIHKKYNIDGKLCYGSTMCKYVGPTRKRYLR